MESVDVVDEAVEEVTELLDATPNELDASKDLNADPNPTSNTAPVPTVEANVEPAPNVPSFEGPVATEDTLVENAQNEESAMIQEPIPARSLQEEIASESSIIGDAGVFVSQEPIAAREGSDTGPIVEEDSTPVTEIQLVDETAPSMENMAEESTVELEDPIAIPEPITEESPVIVETTLESMIPVVETSSVIDKPELSPAEADISSQASLGVEGRQPFSLVPL